MHAVFPNAATEINPRMNQVAAELVNEFATGAVKVDCRTPSVAGVGIAVGGLIQTAVGLADAWDERG